MVSESPINEKVSLAATVHGMNLSKVYERDGQRFYGLYDVSAEIYPGEMVAILGKRGSGKTTLLNILGGLLRPDWGRLLINDQDMSELGDSELAEFCFGKIAFLLRPTVLDPNLTALKNVEAPLKEQGMAEQPRRERAWAAIQAVELDGRQAEQRVGLLTMGQRHLVAAARSILDNPPILFADEPAWGLDGATREDVMALFQRLNNAGRTIVLSTPDSSVATYCRRVLRMAEGQCIEDVLVSKRRIVAASKTQEARPETPGIQDEVLCPRCNQVNSGVDQACQRCNFLLPLSKERERALKAAETEGDALEELKKIPFFGRLGTKSIQKLMPSVERQRFPQGEVIIREGDEGDAYFVIRTGEAQVVVRRQGEPDIPIAKLGPQEGFGEMALLTGQPRAATVVASTHVDLWRLAKPAFDELLADNLSLSLYFNEILSTRLKSFKERVFPSV